MAHNGDIVTEFLHETPGERCFAAARTTRNADYKRIQPITPL
jgi:hypothetical protein